MDALRQIFAIRYPYTDPLAQRTAGVLARLNASAAILAGALILGVIATWTGPIHVAPELAALIILLIALAALVTILLNHGHLEAAARLYVGYTLGLTLGLTFYYGLGTAAPLSLALPVVAAGMLLDRRGVGVITLLDLGGLALLGIIDVHGLGRLPSFGAGVLPPALLIGVYGAAQAMAAGEFRACFRRGLDAEDKLGTVVTLSEDVIRQADRETIMAEFGALMHATFSLQQVLIYLQDPDNPGLLHLRSGTGLAAQRAQMEGRRVSAGADLPLAQAFRERQPILVRATDLAHLRAGFLPGTYAQLLLPLQFGDQTFGVVDLQSASTEAFTPSTVELLTALTRLFSANIHTRELTSRLEQHAAEQEQLYAHIQRHAEELQQLRRQAAGVVWGRFFRERGANVLGYDLDPASREPIPSDQMPPALQETFASGKATVTPQDGGYRLSLPIVVRGQVLGAMAFDITREGELPGHLVDLASTIADRLSLALDNARLMEEAQTFAYREQQVGAISTQLQRASNLEELLAMAAETFNAALGGSRTRVRLQSSDMISRPPAREPSTTGEGGAA